MINKKFCFLQLENKRCEEGKDDSDSDDDCTDVFNVISDLKKDIEKYEEEYKIFRSKGFDNFEESRQIVRVDQILNNISVMPLLQERILHKCEGSYKFLGGLHKETANNKSFVARKNGREIRCEIITACFTKCITKLYFSSAKQMEGPGKGFKEGSEAEVNLFDYQTRYGFTQGGDFEPSEQVESKFKEGCKGSQKIFEILQGDFLFLTKQF